MTEDNDRSAGPVRGILAVLLGLVVVAAAVMRCQEYVYKFRADTQSLYLVPIAALIGLAFAARRGGLSLNLIGLALAGSGVALAGMPELPEYASVDAFGFSPHFRWVVLAMLAATIGFAGSGGVRRLGDGAVAMFVAFSAFSGPMFIRDPDVYFPLLILLGLTAALSIENDERRSPWRIPFLLGFLALVVVTALTVVSAEDRHRHITGWTRMVIAGLPLVALGVGSMERVRKVLGVFAGMVLCGVVCAAITILEAGYFFSLPHALETRLRLFGQDPNIIAPYFAVAPPLLLAMIVSARGWLARSLLTVTLVGSLAAVKLTGSKTSLVAAAAGVAAFLVLAVAVALWRKAPSLRKVIAAVGVVILVGGAAGAFAVKDRVLTHPSLEFRAYLWNTAVHAIQDHPLLGYGFLCREPLMAYAQSSELDGRPKDTHPHQIVLNMAMGAGVPAAILFVGLVLWFFLRMILVAMRAPTREDWMLALAALGSGVALLIANTLDQGLSLNTPFALHLGLLLGVGALLVIRTREATESSVVVRRGGKMLLVLVGVLVALLDLHVLAGNRLYHRINYHVSKGNLERAASLSELALRVNPWSLVALMQRAEVLERQQDITGAIDVLWKGARRHEMSPDPWDKLSLLENLRGGGFQSANNALAEAVKRDPTGPHVSEWALREAVNLARLRRHDEAVERMAEAFRYDAYAPSKLSWRKDDQGKWIYDDGGALPRQIYLEALLVRNKGLIRDLCRTDWIKARRIATTIAVICRNYYLYELGLATVEEHERHAPEKWLPLATIGEQLKEAERRRRIEETGEAVPSTKREFQESDFEGTKGNAAIFLSRGHNFLENGEPQRALKAYEEGIDQLYDIYSEREYAKGLVDGALKACLKMRDFPLAWRWQRSVMYFERTPVGRAERNLWIAKAYAEDGQHKRVLHTLAVAVPYMRKLAAQVGGTIIANTAIMLKPYASTSAPENLQEMAQDVVDLLDASSPQGRLLRAYVAREIGDKERGRQLLLELAQDDPRWNLDRAKAPDWKPPPPEYRAPRKQP